MRLLTNTVPLSPRRSERAFGTPLMNTSILNPFGSLSCGTGSLSAAIGKGGGLTPRSLLAASEVGWLGGGGGGGGGPCCAVAGGGAAARGARPRRRPPAPPPPRQRCGNHETGLVRVAHRALPVFYCSAAVS